MHGRQALHLQQHAADLVVLGREAVCQLTAHHQLDDALHRHFRRRLCGDPRAIAHDGHFVGDTQDLLHLVGNINDAAAAVPQHIDDAEQVLHFLLSKRGGGLVEHDDVGMVRDSFGNLHHLALGHGHRAHNGARVHMDAQIIKNRRRISEHLFFGREGPHRGIAAEPDIVHNIALECLVQLLMHHGDAVFQRLFRGFEADFLPIQQDLPAVLAVNAEQALHQGGLARPVFPHQRMHRAALYRQRNIVERLDAGEGLADIFHFEQNAVVVLHSASPPRKISDSSRKIAARRGSYLPAVCLIGSISRCKRRTGCGSWHWHHPHCSCRCRPSGPRRWWRSWQAAQWPPPCLRRPA